MNVLLLEDDSILANEVRYFLLSKKVECDIVYDGELFFRKLNNKEYDVFLLDINVPKINGLDVCKKIREKDLNTPILMLTAYGEIEDKVEAFKMGADDYLVKPFHLEELFIRVNALYRRRKTPQAQEIVLLFGDLSINIDQKIVKRGDTEIHLTPKEFKLLAILAEANGRTVSKQVIADILWDYHIETTQNTIEVYISFLRKKIDRHTETKLIHTKVGYGYYLKEE